MTSDFLKFREVQEIYNSHFWENINNEQRESFFRLSAKEKLDSAFRLYSFAREIIKATIPKNLSEIKQKELLFIALYKDDFTAERFELILNKLFNIKIE